MLQGTKVVTTDTKLEKGAVSTRTVVTFNLAGCSEEHVVGLAMRQAVVMLQDQWRRAGAIPSKVDVNLSEIGSGRRALTADEAMAIMLAKAQSDPEFAAKLKAQLK